MSARVFLFLIFVTASCANDHANQTSSSEESSSEDDALYQDRSPVDWQEDWYEQAQALRRQADGIVEGTANMRAEADALSQQAERLGWGARIVSEQKKEAETEMLGLLQKAENMRQKANEERKKADEFYEEAEKLFAKVRKGGDFAPN